MKNCAATCISAIELNFSALIFIKEVEIIMEERQKWEIKIPYTTVVNGILPFFLH